MQKLLKEVHLHLVLIISIKNQLRDQAWKTNDLLIRSNAVASRASQRSVQNGPQILRTKFIYYFLPVLEYFASVAHIKLRIYKPVFILSLSIYTSFMNFALSSKTGVTAIRQRTILFKLKGPCTLIPRQLSQVSQQILNYYS